MDFLKIQGLMRKLQAYKKINDIQEDIGAQALLLKFSIRENQDDSKYTPGVRRHR
jgi:hypothetical protein